MTSIPQEAICRIAILVLPSFNAMATMALTDPFRAANYLGAQALYSWDIISLDGAIVTEVAGTTREPGHQPRRPPQMLF